MTNGDRLDRIEAHQEDADRQLAQIRGILGTLTETVGRNTVAISQLIEVMGRHDELLDRNDRQIAENNQQIQILIEDSRADRMRADVDRQAWQAEMTRLREDWLRGREQ